MSELVNQPSHVKATVEKSDGKLIAVASTASEDRHGEVVSVDGWDLKNFKKNPVLQWAHDHTEPAIGLAKNIKVEGIGKKARLIFEPVFHEHTEKARALKAMVEDGILNSFSVGFRPLEMDGNVFTKQELLEVSLVNVPANADARMLAYKSLQSKGLDTSVLGEIKSWTENRLAEEVFGENAPIGDDAPDKDETIESLQAQLDDMQDKYELLVKGLKNLNPHGRSSDVVKTRLSLNKVIARAIDKMLEQAPNKDSQTVTLAKVVKRANEKLIVDQKQEIKLNGKN